jgi:hypothetical protein
MLHTEMIFFFTCSEVRSVYHLRSSAITTGPTYRQNKAEKNQCQVCVGILTTTALLCAALERSLSSCAPVTLSEHACNGCTHPETRKGSPGKPAGKGARHPLRKVDL